MKHLKFFYIIVATLLLSGCGTLTTDRTFSPTVNRFYMSDLVYLGETEVEITYSTYLGIFKKIHTLNEKEYDSSNKKRAFLDGQAIKSWGLNKAAYKALEEYPEGRYFQIVRRIKEKNRLFLGSEVKETAIIRVYKYKN